MKSIETTAKIMTSDSFLIEIRTHEQYMVRSCYNCPYINFMGDGRYVSCNKAAYWAIPFREVFDFFPSQCPIIKEER